VNLGVLLADRAAGASSVWSNTQSKAAPLSAWAIRGPEAICAGHRGESEIQPLAMERAGNNESFPNFVDCIDVTSLPAARLPADHTQIPVRLQQLPPVEMWRAPRASNPLSLRS
jgi:hypothetical protein